MYSTVLLAFLALICLILFKSNESRKLKNFDQETTLPLRGLLAILIVFHHVSQQDIGYIPYICGIFQSLGAPIVGVFFMISGYGLFLSYRKRGEKYLDGFLRKRYSKILPVFIILTLLCIFMMMYDGMSLSELYGGYRRGWTPLPHSWFIYSIVFVYAAFYLSARIGRSLLSTGLIFTAFIIIYIIGMKLRLHFPLYWYCTILCTSAGYFIGYFEKRITEFGSRHIILFFGGVMAGLCFSYYIRYYAQDVSFMIWLVVHSFSVYVIIRALGMANLKVLRWIGVFSLEVYLVHGIFIKFIFLKLMSGMSFPAGALLYPAALACAIPAAYFLNRLSNRVGSSPTAQFINHTK